MNHPVPASRAPAQPPGLVDTLQAGFNTVNRNVWLLALPIALDLLLWLGPQLSIAGLVDRWLVNATVPPGADAGLARSFEDARRTWQQLVSQGGLNRFNLLSLLAVPPLLSLPPVHALPPLGIPSLRAAVPGQGSVIPLGTMSSATAVVILSFLVRLGLSALFYGLLGQAVRERSAAPRRFAGDFGRLYLGILGLTALVLALAFTVGAPLLAAVGAAALSAPVLASVLAPIALSIVLWIYFYLFFTTDALFVSRVPPQVAIQHSIAVVRYNFWSTMGFIALLMVISAGFWYLWLELAHSLGPPGMGLALVGHIYISTGLAAASMTYYMDRHGRLRSS